MAVIFEENHSQSPQDTQTRTEGPQKSAEATASWREEIWGLWAKLPPWRCRWKKKLGTKRDPFQRAQTKRASATLQSKGNMEHRGCCTTEKINFRWSKSIRNNNFTYSWQSLCSCIVSLIFLPVSYSLILSSLSKFAQILTNYSAVIYQIVFSYTRDFILCLPEFLQRYNYYWLAHLYLPVFK